MGKKEKILCFLCVLCVSVVNGDALAQGKAALTARLDKVVPRFRSNGPTPLVVTFDWEGDWLLEGRLQMVLRDGGRVAARYLGPDLTLTSGEQSFNMLLPPVSAASSDVPLDVLMTFQTRAGETVNPGKDVLFCPASDERALVICVSSPQDTGPNERFLRIMQSMRLEHYHPQKAKMPRRALSTYRAQMPPEDMPAFAQGYCPFDIVLLAREGWSGLKLKQLQALERWVQAGGSVCVMPGLAVKQYHVDFLNSLSGAGPRTGKVSRAVERPLSAAGTFSVNIDGELEKPASLGGKRIGLYHAGLGRMAVVVEPLDGGPDLELPDWRRAVAFLWKVRAGHVGSIVGKGVWSKRMWETWESGSSSRWDAYRGEGDADTGQEFRVMPIPVGPEFLDTLIPQTSRVVPFGLIILLLLLFVVLIGPADYFLLGFLKKRYLTWVLFPAVSIGLTVFMVLLSEAYMGRTDHENSIVFVDVGEGGRVLRHSRVSVVFAGSHRTVERQVTGGLFSALDHARFRGDYGYGRYSGSRYESAGGGPVSYSGRIPASYTVTQQVRQWTPQLNRYFSLDPPEGAVKLNWDAVDPSNFSSYQDRWRVQDQLFGKAGVEAQACLFNRSVRHVAIGPSHLPWEILKLCSVRPAAGLFNVVSQIAPAGGDNFEDLALLDSTDPGQWLLMVVVPVGSDYHVYRRLYHGVKK